MEQIIHNAIHQSLQEHLYSNAIFLSERLYAETKSLHDLHLLATSYFLSGDHSLVYYFLKNKSSEWRTKSINPIVRKIYYLFGQCCVKLQKFEEAESALRQIYKQNSNDSSVNYLLGVICRNTNRSDSAIQYFQRALHLNPFLWSALEHLAQLGGDVDTSVFQVQNLTAQYDITTNKQDESNISIPKMTPTMTPKITPKTPKVTSNILIAKDEVFSPVNFDLSTPIISTPVTPAQNYTPSNITPSNTITPTNNITPSPYKIQAPAPVKKFKKAVPRRPSQSNERSMISSKLFDSGKKIDLSDIDDFETPKHDRLSFNIPEFLPPTPVQQQIPISHQQKSTPGIIEQPTVKKHSSIEKMMTLIRTLAEAYRLFCQYKCKDAIQILEMLEKGHYHTGWVLTTIGRAFFEMGDYVQAEKTFEKVLRIEPYRLKGLEVYSTVLWHLKKEKKLSFLAHHMSEIDKHSPYTFCAIGNCYSLQKDHETALKFFQRATTVNNMFAYGYTLAGHEYSACDNIDEALQCYRNAIRVDSRHYNAWYGLGTVYLRQQKYELAEVHFRQALRINPRSSVLFCYLGTTLAANKKYNEALQMLQHAIAIQPDNPMAKFKKANVLISLKQYQNALNELESLKEIAPKEAPVYFTMGKIYKKLGQKDKALYHLNMALDLENASKDKFYKNAISKLFEDDEEEDESDDDENSYS